MAKSVFDETGRHGISSGVTNGHAYTSNILLGYPDEEIEEYFGRDVNFTTSKIGGQPVNLGYNVLLGVNRCRLKPTNPIMCQMLFNLFSMIFMCSVFRIG